MESATHEPHELRVRLVPKGKLGHNIASKGNECWADKSMNIFLTHE